MMSNTALAGPPAPHLSAAAAEIEQHVYLFGASIGELANARDKTLAGGKGANLAAMASLGLPVPPGFTISTEECRLYLRQRSFSEQLAGQVAYSLKEVEILAGKRFGDPDNPLLVSVRSGARVSMPGMMDTILNLGLNHHTVKGLAAAAGDERFAWDSYRRFIQMYSDVVLGIDRALFEEVVDEVKQQRGYSSDPEMSASDWKAIVAHYEEIVEIEHGAPFPQDVDQQLWTAIAAVFDSWDCERARIYRQLNGIPGEWGTAVNVQAMVFGNMGETSATGVAFTRDPASGENVYYGEWLPNAQGEDVVAGIRTPQYLTRSAREKASSSTPSMEEAMPRVYAELVGVLDRLEQHYKDMQDVEFTVERGKLWMLQTRAGKRTAKAALKIAVDMVQEGSIDKRTAVLRIDPSMLDQLLHPRIDPSVRRELLATGLAASPGAASGRIVLDADSARAWAERDENVILVRVETSPEDIYGMHLARGIVTARGGMTSHAAVVARGMGRPCVAGTAALSIDLRARRLRIGDRDLSEGDVITIDGGTGEIIAGELPMIEPERVGAFGTIMEWADQFRRMRVRANAETPEDCRAAREFGADGIGLCRTEHMFFDDNRIGAVREMIVAEDEAARRKALDKLLPEQRSDFIEIFTVMAGLPVNVRLLDPPLHEFLPSREQDYVQLAKLTGRSIEQLKRRAAELRESNPMLGHRGCRLGITCPEIYEMQARAIFEAACDISTTSAGAPLLEIMIPLVTAKVELNLLRALVDRVALSTFQQRGKVIEYSVGTMIELPRAALMAAQIAEDADFFSFGTNDLTQTTLGISRDDSGSFLPVYLEQGIYARDPFVTLDLQGAGELMAMGAERGRACRPDLKLGICGEHGGDPASIAFCEEHGFDYVSASPFRVPVARLAAAQATLRLSDARITS